MIARALGTAPATWVVWGDALPPSGAAITSVVLDFVSHAPAPAARAGALADVATALAEDGTLVVVDHNRPRRRLAAFWAVAAPPRPPGLGPRARWRRLAYPTAREVQGAGFRVERLALVAGERVQVVFGRRSPA